MHYLTGHLYCWRTKGLAGWVAVFLVVGKSFDDEEHYNGCYILVVPVLQLLCGRAESSNQEICINNLRHTRRVLNKSFFVVGDSNIF